jgi:hypothetical protein
LLGDDGDDPTAADVEEPEASMPRSLACSAAALEEEFPGPEGVDEEGVASGSGEEAGGEAGASAGAGGAGGDEGPFG